MRRFHRRIPPGLLVSVALAVLACDAEKDGEAPAPEPAASVSAVASANATRALALPQVSGSVRTSTTRSGRSVEESARRARGVDETARRAHDRPTRSPAAGRNPEFELWLRESLGAVLPVAVQPGSSWCGRVPLLPPAGVPIDVFLATPTTALFLGDAAQSVTGFETREFSTTNLQERGVDEADRVKFDGDTLYVASDGQASLPLQFSPVAPIVTFAPSCALDDIGDEIIIEPRDAPEVEPATIRVLRADEEAAAVEPLTEITVEGMVSLKGLYLLEEDAPGRADRLVVLGARAPGTASGSWWDPWSWQGGSTRVRSYDVSDPARPEVAWGLEIDGALVSSRRVGHMLHLVTRYTPFLESIHTAPVDESEVEENRAALENARISDLMPTVSVDGGRERSLVRPEQCFLPEDDRSAVHQSPTLLTVTSIDLRRPTRWSSVCMGGVGEEIYSSTRALYLTSWRGSDTVVHKFRYTERGPSHRGSARVPGGLAGVQRAFSMGEHDDVLGILTSTWQDTPSGRHRLTLLGEAAQGRIGLEELAHLPNEGEPAPIGKPGETVHGVRFMGDRVYVVTYRKVDPLYVIDRSDPRHPRIEGALEVPGFSDYLHPLGRDLLLGIGKDTVADVRNDWFQGIKVELFDVSDPGAPASADSLVIGGRGSQSAALSDHHAVAHLPAGPDGHHRFAVPVQLHDDERLPTDPPNRYLPWLRTGLHLFEVTEGAVASDARLQLVGEIVAEEADSESPRPSGGNASTTGDRSVIQGDAVHYVHSDAVWSAPWDDPAADTGPQ
jgi:hypothetical protein